MVRWLEEITRLLSTIRATEKDIAGTKSCVIRHIAGIVESNYYTYAYFDNSEDAFQFADKWWLFQSEYVGSYDGGDVYCYVYAWTAQYYDNGEWYQMLKK